MELIHLEKDIEVYYVEAASFPDDILTAHETLHAAIPYTQERRYFGLSRPENGLIVYKAGAEVLASDQVKEIGYPSMIIGKGRYRCMTLTNYMQDIEGIGKAFNELIAYQDIDPDGYCVEWYINDHDVKCMVRLKEVD